MSPSRPLVSRRTTAALASLAIALPGALVAQGNKGGAGITLAVRDSTGIAIVGAELTTSSSSQRSVSGPDGTFRVIGVIAGPTTLHVRRLGYRPDSMQVDVQPGTAMNL